MELPPRVQVQDFIEDPQYETSRAIRAQIKYLEELEYDQMLVKKYVQTSKDFTSPNALFTLEDVAQNEEAVRTFIQLNGDNADLMKSLTSVQNELAKAGQLSKSMLVDRDPIDVRPRDIALEDRLKNEFKGDALSQSDEIKLFDRAPNLLTDYAKSLRTSRMVKFMQTRFFDWYDQSKYSASMETETIGRSEKYELKKVIQDKELSEKANDAVYNWLKNNVITQNSDFVMDDVYESESATKLWLEGVDGLEPIPRDKRKFFDDFVRYWWLKRSFLGQIFSLNSLPEWGKSLVESAIDNSIYVPPLTSRPITRLITAGVMKELPAIMLRVQKEEDKD